MSTPAPRNPLRIELWNLSDLFGVIVEFASGVIWTNQTAGIACMHPELEGIFVPLDGRPPRPDPCLNRGISGNEDDHDAAQAFLEATSMADRFAVDTSRPVAEAWIPVIVKQHADPAFAMLSGRRAVITYVNSD